MKTPNQSATAPAARPQDREQAQDGFAGQRAQAHRLGEPALHGHARAGFFEVRPEAEHARCARRLRGSLRALQALAQCGKAFQDVFGLGVELVFFHRNSLCAKATHLVAFSADDARSFLHPSNGGGPSRLQSTRPVAAVAELESLGR